MGGCVTSKDELEKITVRNKMVLSQIQTSLSSKEAVPLPKGGILMKTKIGNIQFGIPPETIKDSMNAGLNVPNYFIVPTQRFETRLGLSVAEFEFPAYFNFFVLKKKVNLIVDKKGEEAIRTIFQETLLGPKDVNTEMDETMPKEDYVDLRAELDYFAVNPFNKSEKLDFDTLINIINYDEENKAIITDKDKDGNESRIIIVKKYGYFELYEDDEKKATFNDEVVINGEEYPAQKFLVEQDRVVQEDEDGEITPNKSVLFGDLEEEIAVFDIPDFGITVLGNSHGFDCCGSTSGFILWVNKRGIVVDPPPFTSMALRQMNIPPNLIDKIILTHCHSDHDAGAFQKVLAAGTIEIITTETIMASFTRKYSATMGSSIAHVMSLFEFRPVTIGRETLIYGAKFKFFYSFHSVPTIGFEIEYDDKRLYFSGDTLFDPKKLDEIQTTKEIFKSGRFTQLRYPNFDKYDLIIHESGVPPIHTPLEALSSLPDNVKEKIRVYHIAAKDFKKDSGLKYCDIGLKNTIVLVKDAQRNPILSNLEVVSQFELINQLPLRRITDFMRCLKEETYKRGQFILREGNIGRKFYLVKQGICKVYSRKPGREFSKLKYSGDYFGESAVSGQGIRNATVIAFTDCKLLSVDKNDFQFCFGISRKDGNNRMTLFGRIDNLSKIRKGKMAEFINRFGPKI